MPFDASSYDHGELETAYKIFSELLGELEEARLDTMRQKDDLTPNEAFQLAIEIKVYNDIKELAEDNLNIRELDIARDETE